MVIHLGFSDSFGSSLVSRATGNVCRARLKKALITGDESRLSSGKKEMVLCVAWLRTFANVFTMLTPAAMKLGVSKALQLVRCAQCRSRFTPDNCLTATLP